MTNPDDKNLKALEKRIYLAYQNDGLWDIFLGVILFVSGILMKTDNGAFMGIAPAVLIPIAANIKKSFTRPRLGFVKFSQERETKQKKQRFILSIILTFTVVLGLVNFLAFSSDIDVLSYLRDLAFLPFAFVIALVLGSAGLLFGMHRFMLYAILIFLAFLGAHIAHSEPPVPFVVMGAIITIVGVVYLVRFMRKYPLDRARYDQAGGGR